MPDSALAKLKRSSSRLRELEGLLRRKPPFRYMLETNYQTGERATFAKRCEDVAEECALLCGEVVQNLRSALDHAYWEIVSPFASSRREEKAIQFPFSESAARLEDAVKSRLAPKVGAAFHQAVLDLKPHGEAGGNAPLYLIDRLNNPEKHRELTPIGDFTIIQGTELARQVPGFPTGIGNMAFGMNRRDIVWRFTTPQGPMASIMETKLNVPVAVVLPIGVQYGHRTMIETLNVLSAAATTAISTLRAAAP